MSENEGYRQDSWYSSSYDIGDPLKFYEIQ